MLIGLRGLGRGIAGFRVLEFYGLGHESDRAWRLPGRRGFRVLGFQGMAFMWQRGVEAFIRGLRV